MTLLVINPYYDTAGIQITPTLNDKLLNQLSQNYYEGGQFYTYNGRTSTSTSSYNTLINRSWQIFGADLPSPPSIGKLRIKGVGQY
jgi:hypothetical protein